jgi:hypothetical protein
MRGTLPIRVPKGNHARRLFFKVLKRKKHLLFIDKQNTTPVQYVK